MMKYRTWRRGRKTATVTDWRPASDVSITELVTGLIEHVEALGYKGLKVRVTTETWQEEWKR